MKITKKLLSLTLALVLVLGMLPAAAFATDTEGQYVYLSISFDGKYIDDTNGNPIVYVPVPLETIASVDLTAYGLENMLFDGDEDGVYDTTALQLLIYAHEELYGGDWSEVNFDALPGSSYFAGGIFGFTENLVYFHNGDFPVDDSQQSDYMTVGATSDRIVLEAGDFLDVASFSCYGFVWDQAGGFHLFADESDNYTHDYTATAGQALSVKLKHAFCDLMYGQSWVKEATDYEVYYGTTFGEAEGSVTTDESGCADITFPDAGTYYVWCDGGMGTDDGTHGSCDYCLETGMPCIVSAPAYARVTVTGGAASADLVIPSDPPGGSFALTQDVTQASLTVPAGVTLDLNGHLLTVDSLVSLGQIVDSAGDGGVVAGQLEVSGNDWLPILDSTGCYRFYEYQLSNLGVREAGKSAVFGFALDFEDAAAYTALLDCADVQITVTLAAGESRQTFAFSSELIRRYVTLQSAYPNMKTAMILTVTGIESLAAGTEIAVTPAIAAVAGNLQMTGTAMTYTA